MKFFRPPFALAFCLLTATAFTCRAGAVTCEAALSETQWVYRLAALSIDLEHQASDAATQRSTVGELRTRLQNFYVAAATALGTTEEELLAAVTAEVGRISQSPAELARARAAAENLAGSALTPEDFDFATKAIAYAKQKHLRCDGPAAFAAARGGDLAVVRGYVAIAKYGKLIGRLLDNSPDVCLNFEMTQVDPDGQNLLEAALAENQEEVGLYLVEQGLRTTLEIALAATSPRVAQALRHRGVESKLSVVLQTAHEAVASQMVLDGVPFGPADLFVALAHSKLDATDKMLEAHPEFVDIEVDGRRLLGEAIRLNQSQFYAIYARAGADLNARESETGNTPAVESVIANREDALEWLIKKHVNLALASTDNGIPLEAALTYGRPEHVRRILLAQSSLSGTTSHGMSYRALAEALVQDTADPRTLRKGDAPDYEYVANVATLKANWVK